MESEKLCRVLASLIANDSSHNVSVVDFIGSISGKRASFIKRRTFQKASGPKEEKIFLCNAIVDSLENVPQKNTSDIPRLLEISLDTILACCDDAEASVRLAAEEALNRILHTHISSHPVTILVQLFKEIRKNENARCVKVAWTKFAAYSCYIKPQRFRCRAFIANLAPCIIHLARRDEEIIHEAIMEGIHEVLKTLGRYLIEGEVKALLRAFIANLSSENSLKRRTAACVVVDICRFAINPSVSCEWLLKGLLSSIRSSADNVANTFYCGILLAIRNLLYFLQECRQRSCSNLSESNLLLVQVLKILLDCCDHPDHNVQGFALDALHSLLLNSDHSFKLLLIAPGGFTQFQSSPVDSNASSDFSLGFEELIDPNTQEPAESPNLNSELHAKDFGLIEQPLPDRPTAENTRDRSDTVSIVSSVVSEELMVHSDEDNNSFDTSLDEKIDESIECEDYIENNSENGKGSENLNPLEPSESESAMIGSFYDCERSTLDYVSRYLCRRFLLVFRQRNFKKGIRVSIQSLALNCLLDIFRIDSSIFEKTRFLVPTSDEAGCIYDVWIFMEHEDPLLKSYGAAAACCFMSEVRKDNVNSSPIGDLSKFHRTLLRILCQDSAGSCRMLLGNLEKYLISLLNSTSAVADAVFILFELTALLDNAKFSYWLLKTELCRFLRAVPLHYLSFIEAASSSTAAPTHNRNKLKDKILTCLMKKLGDEDHRVRHAAAETIAWLPIGMGYCHLGSVQTYEMLHRNFEEKLKHQLTDYYHCLDTGLIFPYTLHVLLPAPGLGSDVLSLIVGRLLDILICGCSKEKTIGTLSALSMLSAFYPPTTNCRSWFGCVEDLEFSTSQQNSPTVGILNRILGLLTFTSLADDLHLQTIGVQLLGNLFAGYSVAVLVRNKTPASSEGTLSQFRDASLRQFSENLLKHLARILSIFKAVLDGLKTNDFLPLSKALIPLPSSPGSSLSFRRRQDIVRRTLRKPKVGSFDFRSRTSDLSNMPSMEMFGALFESIKKAWAKHRSQSVHKEDKLYHFIRSILTCLSRILEMMPASTLALHTEELLSYLKSTISIDGSSTVYCLEQLLNALFGCNLIQIDCAGVISDARSHFESTLCQPQILLAFVELYAKQLLFSPHWTTLPLGKYNQVDSKVAHWGLRWSNSLKQKRQESVDGLFKNHSKEKRGMMSETIRLFESLVIKSLQAYTSTCDVQTQIQVLDLLIVLLQFHVNYSVLDGDHVFLKYVVKQVDLIELGQIADSNILLPYLFRFLIGLSHDKHISQQNILTCGHIMQYCDRLMVDGEGGKRILPILHLLFDDAFKRRISKSSVVEEVDLEAQVEMVMSTTLRCLPELETFDLFHKYLTYQWTKSNGNYEVQIRNLIDGIFSRLEPAPSVELETLEDYELFLRFLEEVGTELLSQSSVFISFFGNILNSLCPVQSANLSSIGVLSAVVEVYVMSSAIQPLFRLFVNRGQHHPLESPLESSVDEFSDKFVSIVTVVLDSLLLTPSVKDQLSDFLHCSLLRSLTYLVQIVDQGPIKVAIRAMNSQMSILLNRKLSPSVKLSWMCLRYATAGCDFFPRHWNRGSLFPVENHFCSVIWKFIRPLIDVAVLPARSLSDAASNLSAFCDMEESVRLLQDVVQNEASVFELEILNQCVGKNAALYWTQTFCNVVHGKCELTSAGLLYKAPANIAVQLGILQNLLDANPNDFLTYSVEDLALIKSLWIKEQPSALRTFVFQMLKIPEVKRDSELNMEEMEEHLLNNKTFAAWHRNLAQSAIFNREQDSSETAALLRTMDEETILTILTDGKFSVSNLRSCLQAENDKCWMELGVQSKSSKLSSLFQASKLMLLQHLSTIRAAESEPAFPQQDEFSWLLLAAAFIEYGERMNEIEAAVPEESLVDVIGFIISGYKFIDGSSSPRLTYRRILQCLLVCLENVGFSCYFRQGLPFNAILIRKTISMLIMMNSSLADYLGDDVDNASECYSNFENLLLWVDHFREEIDDLTCNVIKGLARLPEVLHLVHIPPSARKAGYGSDGPETSAEAISVDFLQDCGILKEFVGRVCLYGWTSRSQFEEVWMALLSVVSSVPLDDESESEEAMHENSATGRIVTGRIALRCVTALLLESVLAPYPGNPLRNQRANDDVKSPHRQLEDFARRISTKKHVASSDTNWVQHFIQRPRRQFYFHYTHVDGLDKPYCRWVMKNSPQGSSVGAGDAEVDLRSCLRFVMDLYGHWTTDEKLKRLSPYLLDEITKSTLHISNIFHDERNFQWMVQFVKQVLKFKNIEESLFYGHLVDALGKAISVLQMDKENFNFLKKVAESRTCQSLVNRICTLRAILRVKRQQEPREQKNIQWLMNLANNIYEFENKSCIRCSDALDILFNIFFLELDCCVVKVKETVNVYYDILQQELHSASNLSFPTLNNLFLLLGRHLIDKRLDDGVLREQLVKITLESINLPPPRSMAACGFLLCCLKKSRCGENNVLLLAESTPSIADSHSDPLFIMTLEKMSVIQQRMHKSFLIEQEILGAIYLEHLLENFPFSETINRVMAEFQTCSPESLSFVAGIVAKVFRYAKERHLDAMTRDWITLSLNNFVNRSPRELGIWSLACLFCLASSSAVLNSIFPVLCVRRKMLDGFLRELFLRSGLDFYHSLEVSETRKNFLEALRSASSSSSLIQMLFDCIPRVDFPNAC